MDIRNFFVKSDSESLQSGSSTKTPISGQTVQKTGRVLDLGPSSKLQVCQEESSGHSTQNPSTSHLCASEENLVVGCNPNCESQNMEIDKELRSSITRPYKKERFAKKRKVVVENRKFREKWFEHEDLKDWIERCPFSKNVAYCKYCQKKCLGV
jgi:hypothetical protein